MNFRLRTYPRRNRCVIVFTSGALAAVIAMGGQPATSQIAPAAPSSGLMNPRAIAYSPATGKVYAVDTSQGSVRIYNDKSGQTHRIKVGASPVSIAVNAKTGTIYVANAGDGTVSVIDGTSDEVGATVPIGSHPYSIAASAATGKVYVSHAFSDHLSILDGATNKATDLKTGSSDLIAIDDRTGTIYLLGYGGAVKVLDGHDLALRERAVGKHAWGLALNEATGAVYVTRIENAELAALDGSGSGPTVLPAGAIPCAIVVDSKTGILYVANYGDDTVSVIDAKGGRATATVLVGHRPESIAFDAARDLVFVANTGDSTVTVIGARKNVVLATLPAGKSPYALAVVPGSSRLYVANESEESSSTVVDLAGIRGRIQ